MKRVRVDDMINGLPCENGCEYVEQDGVFTCTVHTSVRHVCDDTCTLAVFCPSGATYACPISGRARERPNVALKGDVVDIQHHGAVTDSRAQVLSFLEVLMPTADVEDREALAYEIARVRGPYHERADASLSAHVLSILHTMKTPTGWTDSGTTVIPHDDVVAEHLQTRLEELNDPRFQRADINRGLVYIRRAVSCSDAKSSFQARKISFTTVKRNIPEQFIVRPREEILKQLKKSFIRHVYAPKTTIAPTIRPVNASRFGYSSSS